MSYPEHEKMKAIQPKSQAIGDFLTWLGERGIWLAEFETPERLVPYHFSTQELLARYFEIDRAKIGKEKDAMLEEMRKMNEPK